MISEVKIRGVTQRLDPPVEIKAGENLTFGLDNAGKPVIAKEPELSAYQKALARTPNRILSIILDLYHDVSR